MTGVNTSRWPWWKAHELRINLVLMLASLFVMSVGFALQIGTIVGISLLLLIFFATYTVYAYVRRDL
ncbi:MAG: hypothetical protein SA339_09735 [Methanomassiliicoccus sp.]|nr:hypothetical protein [Methanomassiliicoccus sp.]